MAIIDEVLSVIILAIIIWACLDFITSMRTIRKFLKLNFMDMKGERNISITNNTQLPPGSHMTFKECKLVIKGKEFDLENQEHNKPEENENSDLHTG